MDIVDRLFELVDQKFKEQRDFAAAIGADASLISRWRNRKSASYIKRLEKISKVLGTTPQYLLSGDSSETTPSTRVSDSDTVQNRQTAAPKDSGLPEEFARLFMSLSPENQNAVTAEMLKRQREQGYRVDQVPGEK